MKMSLQNASTALYLDDLSVGQRFSSAPLTVTADAIKAFAREFDPQPFHINEEAAERTFFGRLAASGWHTAALTMRLNVEGGLPIAGGIVGAGGEITSPTPLRAGDVIHVESEVVAVAPSRSRPDRGMVTISSRTLNQDGAAVQIVTMKLLVFRKRSMQPKQLALAKHRSSWSTSIFPTSP
jgi:acyl dehydratase